MSDAAEVTSELASKLSPADVKKIVNIALSDAPDFSNTARIEDIRSVIEKQPDASLENADAQKHPSDRLETIATSISISATLGLLTATIAPTAIAPVLAAAFIGVVGSKSVKVLLAQLAESLTHRSRK